MRRRKEIDYSKIDECDVLIDHINKRFNKGLNTNIYVIGLSGTGKSSASMRVGEKIIGSRKGEQQLQTVDSFLGLLKAVRLFNVGGVIVIEEVSVLFPSRRAMAEENVNIGKVMDTCRKKMLCIISNAPIWTTIDSHMRAMGHLLIETLKINKKHQLVISKFHRLQTNPLTGKTYRHTMQRKRRDVSRLITKMPNKERWDAYEKSKDDFMEDLYEIMEYKQKKKKEGLDKERGLVQPEVKDLTKKELQVHQLVNVKGLKIKKVGIEMGVTDRRIYAILKNIQTKANIYKENSDMNILNPLTPPIK